MFRVRWGEIPDLLAPGGRHWACIQCRERLLDRFDGLLVEQRLTTLPADEGRDRVPLDMVSVSVDVERGVSQRRCRSQCTQFTGSGPTDAAGNCLITMPPPDLGDRVCAVDI